MSSLKHNDSGTTKYLDGNLSASGQTALADLVLRTLVINKGTNTPKGPVHLQGLDTSTQLHGELLLLQPELLKVHQALGEIPVLLKDFLHLGSLRHKRLIHLAVLVALLSHLKGKG